MSGTGTVDNGSTDVNAAPLETVSAPQSVTSPENGGGNDAAIVSDEITEDLLLEESDMPDEDGSGENPSPQPEPVAPAVAPVAPVEPTPVAPVAPAPVAPVAPVAPAPAPDPSQPPPVAPQTLEEAQQQVRENYTRARTEMETALASTHYKLDDAVTAALEAGDTTALPALIPQMAAKIHMDAMTSAVAHVMQYMPNMLGNLMEAREAETKAQEKFFTAWPQLKLAEHGEVIQRLGLAYRQANPAASAEDFIRDVGAQASLALKLAPPTNAAPSAPPASAPFRPAGAGGGGSAPAPSSASNPFEELALSKDEDDEE